jgi:Cu-Zn family superoxide dismutase
MTQNAVCVIKNERIRAIIYFQQIVDGTRIFGQVFGLNPNQLHGLHIHEYGDLTEDCTSCCAHYNPYNKVHGGMETNDRHVGDLGNIMANEKGVAEFSMDNNLVELTGPFSVIGRSIVVHEDEDDLGKGGYADSLTTGHSGKRIGCGVIGIMKDKKTC